MPIQLPPNVLIFNIRLHAQSYVCATLWAPHFTSVINWSLRLGLGLLTQVQTITKPRVAIIDHAIDIGTKKALVVLRVEVDALSKRESAIRLEDCECIVSRYPKKLLATLSAPN